MKTPLFHLLTLLLILTQSMACSQPTAHSRHDWWETDAKYRTLGGVQLQRGKEGYFKTDYNANKRWQEHFPGVVRVENIGVPHNTTLHFYNESSLRTGKSCTS